MVWATCKGAANYAKIILAHKIITFANPFNLRQMIFG